jgi:uncharacterized protein YjlB
MSEAQSHSLQRNGDIPNSRLPLLFWKDRLPRTARGGTAACALYRKNGWAGTWVYTVYPFWHFHTRGHEVLACVCGSARIGFGGDGGLLADVEVGDVCVVPAGIGHRRFSASGDFQMAGGYPPGQEGNIVRPGDVAVEAALREIEKLPLPEADPISGRADGVVSLWCEAAG